MQHNTENQKKKGLVPATVVAASELVVPATGGIVSRELMRTGGGTVTAFAFDAGEGLSEHTAPFDALVHVLAGRLDVTIAGEVMPVVAGELVLMPANVPHALMAPQPSSMLLVMLR